MHSLPWAATVGYVSWELLGVRSLAAPRNRLLLFAFLFSSAVFITTTAWILQQTVHAYAFPSFLLSATFEEEVNFPGTHTQSFS